MIDDSASEDPVEWKHTVDREIPNIFACLITASLWRGRFILLLSAIPLWGRRPQRIVFQRESADFSVRAVEIDFCSPLA